SAAHPESSRQPAAVACRCRRAPLLVVATETSGKSPDRSGHTSLLSTTTVVRLEEPGARRSETESRLAATNPPRPTSTRAKGTAVSSRSVGTRTAPTRQRPYVLDTSVLLSDPHAIHRFAEHSVVLPVVVITELEAKRHDPEIGFFARQALRNLDDLRLAHERLDFPIAIGDGGSIRVELNHTSTAVLPSGLNLGDNDSRILAVALNLSNDGLDVTVVSKDLPLRVKAASVGLAAEEYRAEPAPDSGWSGVADIALGADTMARLYDDE